MSFPRIPASRPRAAQQGVILVITLIAMVVLLVGLAAILRSVDTSSLIVGNLAFRRDLTNRAEEAISTAKTALAGGTLGTSDVAASHYSATKLANGSTGVPTVLDSDSSYSSAYGNDTAETSGDATISLRYVIDRQCNSGTVAFSTTACEYMSFSGTKGGSAQNSSGDKHIAGTTVPVYRISVRVTGPRNTVGYFQTTYVIK